MKPLLYFFFVCLSFLGCKTDQNKNLAITTQEKDGINCIENGCSGSYSGPEFVNGDDIAHQFSNKMCGAVGDKLKELYQLKNYKKVDFDSIKMITEGMGSGEVIYTLHIPFIAAKSNCEAYTSFDHVGGWNHTPALDRRKSELKDVTMKGHELNISKLMKTPEGLQEYWIQWKNKNVQSDCE